MKSDIMFDLFLFFKIRNLLNKRNELIQTSYLKNFYSDYIIIENYIMRKKFNSIFDYNYEYFNKFRLNEYLIYDKLLEHFNFCEDFYNFEFENELKILDFDKVIKIKKILKNLFLVKLNDKITLLSNEEVQELEEYIINEYKQFVEYDVNLLNSYTYEDLKVLFTKNLSTEHFLRKIVNSFVDVRRTKEAYNLKKVKIKKLKNIDFTNKIVFNESYYITEKDLLSTCYFCMQGSAGSGKTFLLNHVLFNVIKFFDYDKVFYFDTQATFNEYVKRFKYNIENEIYIINEEERINLTIQQIYLFINYFLEKNKMLEDFRDIDIYNLSFEEIKKTFKEYENYYYELKDYKSVRKYEILKDLNELLNSINESKISIFETIQLTKNSVFIFQFKKTIFYELISYFLLDYLYNTLYDRNRKRTFLFLDETQKYINSDVITKKLVDLMREKRQYKFTLFYTSLNYQDTKELVKYTHKIILNDLTDTYLKNMLLSIAKEEDLKIVRQKEKIILNNDFSNFKKIEFKNVLFN